MENNVRQFALAFENLGLKSADVENAMGHYQNRIPQPFPELILKNLAGVSKSVDLKGGYSIYDTVSISEDRLRLEVHGISFFVDRIIGKQLQGAESVAVFVCTIGSKFSDEVRNCMQKGDYIQGYILDTIGSVTVERAMDMIQKELARYEQKRGRKIANRYSPGYCGWHLSAQQELFSLLPENFCDVILTKSSLMQPLKSVSGIIGLGKAVKRLEYPCKICDKKDCFRRWRK